MVAQRSTTPDPSLSKEGNHAAVSSAFCALSPRVLCFHRHSRFVPSVFEVEKSRVEESRSKRRYAKAAAQASCRFRPSTP